MKKLNFFQKILFFVNIIVAFALLIGYVLPFVFPRHFPQISVLSILMPILMIINILFVIIWIVQLNIRCLLSIVILLIGYSYFNRFLKLYNSSETPKKKDITLMSFNVRLFNHYKWNKNPNLSSEIISFIEEKNTDILAIQEYYRDKKYQIEGYAYKYIVYRNNSDHIGQALFSKFPILNKGSLNFPHTANNGIFADILLKKDTLRIYNLHFESLHVNPEEEKISQENSKKLFKNIGKRFAIQQDQVEIYQSHSQKNPYKSIVCGDFNNTAFSHLYREIKGDKFNDSFEKSGLGFGKTFNFPYFPFRIDYILIDTSFTVTSHKTFSVNYSDHFPVIASFR